MRWSIRFGICLGMILLVRDSKADDEAVGKIINRAITVHGSNENKLEKALRVKITKTGTMSTPNGSTDATQELIVNLPQHFRVKFLLQNEERKVSVVIALSKESGWRAIDAESVALTAVEADDIRMEVHARWIQSIISLKDPRLQFRSLPSTRIQNRAVDGLLVSMKNRPDVSLYFDTETGVLIKSSFKGREAGTEVIKDTYFSQYKPHDGILMPTQIIEVHNNRVVGNWTVKSIEFLNTVDPKVFEKP
ncbi:hypothetical protein [Tuwongella immobilis]|uniref:Uncharacterized protein n=1 Tax=Tuwongella immobilis TaxID=692036 RepID=A0A6C2YMW5_9BACT|nr:hypothetical protein [Tuwongella immobilis]VIP02463.1 unnamed protein product [Tuwongella immobilis]VTS01475.1 unnamed protein product [Tuwongella immobilis]